MAWFKENLPACNYCTYCVYSFDIAIRDTRLVQVRMCFTQTLAVASIWERRLFRSARPEVQRQFESSVWSSKYGRVTRFMQAHRASHRAPHALYSQSFVRKQEKILQKNSRLASSGFSYSDTELPPAHGCGYEKCYHVHQREMQHSAASIHVFCHLTYLLFLQ